MIVQTVDHDDHRLFLGLEARDQRCDEDRIVGAAFSQEFGLLVGEPVEDGAHGSHGTALRRAHLDVVVDAAIVVARVSR